MDWLNILMIGALCIASFVVGAKVGQKAAKGEVIELPTINPMEAVRDYKANKAAEAEQKRLEIIMQNIENYDGTSAKQQDVPRG
jgi:uncharacterized protein YneF (UPF0154 family)